MYLGEVKGNVVASTKDEHLVGKKLLIVQPIDPFFKPYGQPSVVVDTVGAGFSDRVLVSKGSSAGSMFEGKSPIDAAIVAIIDSLEMY